MTLILGIDPGKTGALAVLDTETHRVDVWDMPKTTRDLHDLVAGLPVIKIGCVEKLHAGPVMSRTTIARMFEDVGVLKGALAWRDIPYSEVRPQVWKGALNLASDKRGSREMAQRLWPDQADLFSRVKDDGRAEACLIAWYAAGRRQ